MAALEKGIADALIAKRREYISDLVRQVIGASDKLDRAIEDAGGVVRYMRRPVAGPVTNPAAERAETAATLLVDVVIEVVQELATSAPNHAPHLLEPFFLYLDQMQQALESSTYAYLDANPHVATPMSPEDAAKVVARWVADHQLAVPVSDNFRSERLQGLVPSNPEIIMNPDETLSPTGS